MELCGRNILDDMERKPVPTKVQAFCFEKGKEKEQRRHSRAGEKEEDDL